MSGEGAAVTAGALFFLQQPLAWLPVVAVLLLVRDCSGRTALSAAAVLLAAAAATHWLPPQGLLRLGAAGFVAAAGIGVAASLRLRGAPAVLVAGLGGVALALGADFAIATPAEAAGALLVATLLMAALAAAWRLVPPRWREAPVARVGVRVAGAWMGAIGLLLLSLQVARG
ncbi:hypothetical protein [Ramlibacter sp. Leaf400]|uniref:hypothetical protein n=1 Tax=Ramlibacter sp. Leaf400 TaxID=1736365 RepID=UPI0007000BEE|nr:hypothetical protein [Ramlibacter sp. Leaf400]KQT08070.1 hypothetical protein ASG30_16715 [Ramlibacter sp. Leaf400]